MLDVLSVSSKLRPHETVVLPGRSSNEELEQNGNSQSHLLRRTATMTWLVPLFVVSSTVEPPMQSSKLASSRSTKFLMAVLISETDILISVTSVLKVVVQPVIERVARFSFAPR